MKWYIAARQKNKEEVRKLINNLSKKNQDISYDWTLTPDFKPFNENSKKSQEIASNISKALLDTDIFILISDPEGTDMYIELGIAIAYSMKNKNMKIYIVGEHNKRSLMHFHPAIIHANNIDEVFKSELL